MNLLALPFSTQRAMILAPHPDDDAIGAGGLLQRIVARGGEPYVVFVTDGENNPWPQRFLDRKLFITADDRAAWGAMRRREALCSLSLLGISSESAIFLGFPDQGIAEFGRRGDNRLIDALRKIVADIQPSLIVSPSSFDLHADHRAIAYAIHSAAPNSAITTYVVHGNAPADRLLCHVELSPREQDLKRAAIECHASQLALSRERFLSYARRNESFYAAEFEVARAESVFRERLFALRHMSRVIFGAYPSQDDSGLQPAADVQDGAESSLRA